MAEDKNKRVSVAEPAQAESVEKNASTISTAITSSQPSATNKTPVQDSQKTMMSALSAEKEVDKWESDSSTDEKTNDRTAQDNHPMKEELKVKSKKVTIVERK